MRTVLLATALLMACTAPNTSANAEDRRIRLINESRQTIVEFHASNVGRSGYEEDILGRRVVRPGESVVINLDDGSGYCRFDFLTVMRSGQKITKRNVDICRISSYRITD
jgi:hypothetical protein